MARRALAVLLLLLIALLALSPGWSTAQEATPSFGGLTLGPTPTPTPAAGSLVLGPTPTPSLNSYTSPSFGYTLTWDAPWRLQTATSANGVDKVTLTDGVSDVAMTASEAFAGSPKPCLQAAVANLKSSPIYRNVQVAPDATGKPLAGGDASRSWEVFLAQRVEAGRPAQAVAHYVECRTLVPGRAVLLIEDDVSPSAFNAQAPVFEALLGRLVLPRAAGTPAVGIGTPAASPAAVASDCSGVAAWVAATRPRIERTIAIANEVAAAGGTPNPTTLAGYAAEFASMAAAQRGTPAPAAAAAINTRLADAFNNYSSGLTTLLIDAQAGNQSGANQAITLLKQTDTEFQQAVTAGTQLATRCGVAS